MCAFQVRSENVVYVNHKQTAVFQALHQVMEWANLLYMITTLVRVKGYFLGCAHTTNVSAGI
jgi:hypothetical protein